MSMSTHVIGFKPPNAKWKKMKKAWDACTEAGIDIPKEVEEFFDSTAPCDAGVEVDLEERVCCKKYEADMQDGFEINVEKLPKDITVIRFYNEY